MILVDASVFIARFRDEPGHAALTAPLISEPYAVAAITLTEVGMRARRYSGSAEIMRSVVTEVRAQASEVVSIDARLAEAANDAFDRYGKGTGHPARLNFGDCLVYAAARSRGLPLLYKGDDFGRTDLAVHPASQGAGIGAG